MSLYYTRDPAAAPGAPPLPTLLVCGAEALAAAAADGLYHSSAESKTSLQCLGRMHRDCGASNTGSARAKWKRESLSLGGRPGHMSVRLPGPRRASDIGRDSRATTWPQPIAGTIITCNYSGNSSQAECFKKRDRENGAKLYVLITQLITQQSHTLRRSRHGAAPRGFCTRRVRGEQGAAGAGLGPHTASVSRNLGPPTPVWRQTQDGFAAQKSERFHAGTASRSSPAFS